MKVYAAFTAVDDGMCFKSDCIFLGVSRTIEGCIKNFFSKTGNKRIPIYYRGEDWGVVRKGVGGLDCYIIEECEMYDD